MTALRAAALGTVPHGFFGREGGVSTGLYASLNTGLGSSDDADAVRRNRRIAVDAVLPGASLATLHQVHGRDVVTVTGALADDRRPAADGLVTATPGVLLGILTADCVPVLFADRIAGVIGAAHAGWKGALAGVSDATIAAMEALGARRDRIVAAVGPCIGRSSYEVSDEFVQRFTADDPATDRFFVPGRPGHAMFDIEGYVVARLAAAGIRQTEALGRDTCAREAEYFSYRRSCLKGEPDYGRQISLIGIEP